MARQISFQTGIIAEVFEKNDEGKVCMSRDVEELEAKYAKLGDYCWQLYHEVVDLTNPYIEREPEELKEQAKDTLRNFEKDPLFWEIIA